MFEEYWDNNLTNIVCIEILHAAMWLIKFCNADIFISLWNFLKLGQPLQSKNQFCWPEKDSGQQSVICNNVIFVKGTSLFLY